MRIMQDTKKEMRQKDTKVLSVFNVRRSNKAKAEEPDPTEWLTTRITS